MAVCMVFSPPKSFYTKETYAKVMELLGETFPPPSMSLHVMGANDEGDIRIVDIFESAEAFEEFAASHAPVYEEMGIGVEDLMQYVSLFEVERTIK